MSRVSIAIVDSSHAFTRMARFLLTAFYRDRYDLVGTAATAEEGLRLASEHQPAIVLLDLGLGQHTLIASLRGAGAAAVICLGAEDAEGYRDAALTAGADAFLLKADINTTLLPTIQRLLGTT